MSKINEILSKRTPLKSTNGEPDFKKVEGNFKNASNEAVELYKAQLKGQGVSGDYSGGGTFKNEEERKWYEGQIQQRIDSGMSNEEAITDYRNTFMPGEDKSKLMTVSKFSEEFDKLYDNELKNNGNIYII